MQKLKFKATESLKMYASVDGEMSISFLDGESLEVSDDKAEQMLADFPENFSGGSKEPVKAAKPGRPKKDKK